VAEGAKSEWVNSVGSLGRATRRFDCRDGVVAVLQVEAYDVCIFGTQALGDASADSLMCTGDDGHHAAETFCCHVFPLRRNCEFVFLI